MKKTYIIPGLCIVKVNCAKLISTSLGLNDTGADADVVLVKENNTSGSNYNVWNDDWSE